MGDATMPGVVDATDAMTVRSADVEVSQPEGAAPIEAASVSLGPGVASAAKPAPLQQLWAAKAAPLVKAYGLLALIGAVGCAIIGGAIYAGVYNTTKASNKVNGLQQQLQPATRTAYLAIEEAFWSYAPTNGTNNCHGTPFSEGDLVFVGGANEAAAHGTPYASTSTIGATYRTRRYVGYADASFATPLPVDPTIGIFGPRIAVYAGERLRVRVRNRSRHPASFHIFGLPFSSVSSVVEDGSLVVRRDVTANVSAAAKGATGAAAGDGFSAGYRAYACTAALASISTGTASAAMGAPLTALTALGSAHHAAAAHAACADPFTHVAPGSTVEYEWLIPESAGPSATDAQHSGASVGRLYGSLPNAAIDASLAGMVAVHAAPRHPVTGAHLPSSPLTPPALPVDADAEAQVVLGVSNENASPYLALNILDFIARARHVPADGGLFPEPVPINAGLAARIDDASAAAQPAHAQAGGSGGHGHSHAHAHHRRLAASTSPADLVQVPGAAVFPLLDVAPAEAVAALFNAAAAALGASDTDNSAEWSAKYPDAPASTDAAAVALLLAAVAHTGGVGGPHYSLPKLFGVPLGVTVHAGARLVDARAFVAAYGQVAAEEALAPLVAAAFAAEPSFDAGAFEESNLMHAYNGYVYCAAPRPVVKQGAAVRWYAGVLGTEVDMHALHWHANTVVTASGARSDSIQLLPRVAATVTQHASVAGRHLVHCHVSDHMGAGMMGGVDVLPAQPLAGLTPAVLSAATNAVKSAGGSSGVPAALLGPAGTLASLNDAKGKPDARAGAFPEPPWTIAEQLKGGRVREYFIAAETVTWDYASPTGADTCAALATAAGLPGAAALDVASLYPGGTAVPKARYVEYTDATFTVPVPQPAWQGLLGPTLRAEVGDTLRVHFLNRTPRPFSVHPHGVVYLKGSEGAPYADGTHQEADTADDSVPANGGRWTYTWFVSDDAGPGPTDLSSAFWLYHSHTHEVSDENSGLVGGGIIVTRRGAAVDAANGNLRPKDVDREFVVIAKVFNEDQAAEGGAVADPASAGTPPPETLFYALNGLIQCGVGGLTAYPGEKVRWYVGALGNEIDVHHLTWSGHAVTTRAGKRAPGAPLLAGTMDAVDMVASPQPGTYALYSSTLPLLRNGLVHAFTVEDRPAATATAAVSYPWPSGTTRTYYVAAEAVSHDYAPNGGDACVPEDLRAPELGFTPIAAPEERFDDAGTNLEAFTEGGRVFVQRNPAGSTPQLLGSVYAKAQYVAYADAGFTTPIPREPPAALPSSALRGASGSGHAAPLGTGSVGSDPRHLGILGPLLAAAVGDAVIVRFKNALAMDANFHVPNGLALLGLRVQAAPGAAWADVPLAEAASHAIPPGAVAEYTYGVPATAGPGPKDGATVAWSYGSSVDHAHLYAGLVGPVSVARDAAALAHPDVHREFYLAFFIHNENESPLLGDTMRAVYGPTFDPATVDAADEEFVESNLLHAINGAVYCNLPGLSARVGERVRLHLLGFGAELDIHSPMAHAQIATLSAPPATTSGASSGAPGGESAVAVNLLPGGAVAVDVTLTTSGDYVLECGVNDHFLAGMRALLHVEEAEDAA